VTHYYIPQNKQCNASKCVIRGIDPESRISLPPCHGTFYIVGLLTPNEANFLQIILLDLSLFRF